MKVKTSTKVSVLG